MKFISPKNRVATVGVLTVLATLFLNPSPVSAQFPGGDGGFRGRGSNGNNNTPGSEVREAAKQVTAVADEYSNSLIILAPDSFQESISNLVAQLDVPVQDITELRVFTLKNADPNEMAEVLNELFEDQSSGQNQNQRGPGFLFGRRGGQPGGSNNNDQTQRAQQQSTVVAVADPRTSSILVSASKNLMAQIAPMIEELDASTAKKQKVFVYSLQNANSTDVETVLRNLFETQNTRNTRNNTQNNQQNNALTQRQNNAARNQGTTTSGFGSTGAGGGGFGTGN